MTSDPVLRAPESPPLLSIGMDVGGPTALNAVVREILRSEIKLAIAKRAEFPNAGLCINVVFQVPGHISQPNYEGAHASRYARKTNHLLVNVAVPSALEREDVLPFYRASLKDIMRAAREYLNRKRIDVTADPVMELIEHLRQSSS